MEASRRGEARRSTEARELARLAAVKPRMSFRAAIAAGAPSMEKMRECVVDRPNSAWSKALRFGLDLEVRWAVFATPTGQALHQTRRYRAELHTGQWRQG